MDASEKFEKIKTHIGIVTLTTRKTFGKDRAKLSEALRLSFNMVYATEDWLAEVERGSQLISFAEFKNICEALRTSTEEILDCALRAEEGHFLDGK